MSLSSSDRTYSRKRQYSGQTCQPTVLVVDDNLDHLMLAEYVLEDAEFKTFVATSGQEGLLLSIEMKPDLILLDICLPDIDGFELLSRMKRHPGIEHIPVIAVTAAMTTPFALSNRREMKNLLGSLIKPYCIEELTALVSRTISPHLCKPCEGLSQDCSVRRFSVERLVG